MSKFLVTAGWNDDGYQSNSEMIDLSIKGDSNCRDWAQFPKDLSGVTGGVIQDTVIVCGGVNYDLYESFDVCYSLNSKTTTLKTHMFAKRAYAASLVIDETTLWITGGWSSDTVSIQAILDTSELITLEGNELGPQLPIHVDLHALVAIDNTLSMLIGGRTPVSDENFITQTTHYFDHQGNNWIQGPDLMQGRRGHAAGVVTDEVTTEKFVIVTGGDYHGDRLDSTEMLINNQWNQGKMLIMIEFVSKFLCIKYIGK